MASLPELLDWIFRAFRQKSGEIGKKEGLAIGKYMGSTDAAGFWDDMLKRSSRRAFDASPKSKISLVQATSSHQVASTRACAAFAAEAPASTRLVVVVREPVARRAEINYETWTTNRRRGHNVGPPRGRELSTL